MWQEGIKCERPLRLLELLDDGSRLAMRIVTDVPDSASYVALSHCWGPSQPLKLLSSNEALLRMRVEPSSMPVAFQAAAQATRLLGFNHLWIDSLCIVQDSNVDWDRESKKMGDIYRGAVIMLTAPSASSADVGVFSVMKYPEERVSIPFRDPQDGSISLMTASRETAGADTNSSPDGDAVFRRAWIFQEHLLSTRVLYSTAGGFLWECQEATFDESLEGRQPIRFLWQYTDFRKMLSSRLAVSEGTPENDSESNSIHLQRKEDKKVWHDMLQSYMTRRLTYAQDKLPAISGIAKRFAMCFRDEYAAGLWKDSMLTDLAWHTTDLRETVPYPTLEQRLDEHLKPGGTFHAPSWSWASCPGKVEFVSHTIKVSEESPGFYPVTVIEEIRTTPREGSDQFGRLSSCTLQVTGLMKRIWLHRHPVGNQFGIESTKAAETLTVRDPMEDGALGWACAVWDNLSVKALKMVNVPVEDSTTDFIQNEYEGLEVYLLMLYCENSPERMEMDASDAEIVDNVRNASHFERTSWRSFGQAVSLILARIPGDEPQALRVGLCTSGGGRSEDSTTGSTPRLGWYGSRFILR